MEILSLQPWPSDHLGDSDSTVENISPECIIILEMNQLKYGICKYGAL